MSENIQSKPWKGPISITAQQGDDLGPHWRETLSSSDKKDAFESRPWRSKYIPLTTEQINEYNKNRPDLTESDPVLCYAPFKAIYWGVEGEGYACCYNWAHALGEWPSQTIKQIWFGEKAEELRAAIRNNDLSLGCQECKLLIDHENWESVKARFSDKLPTNPNLFPSKMEFELSNACNLECIMCDGDNSCGIRKNSCLLYTSPSPRDS